MIHIRAPSTIMLYKANDKLKKKNEDNHNNNIIFSIRVQKVS